MEINNDLIARKSIKTIKKYEKTLSRKKLQPLEHLFYQVNKTYIYYG